ncbi:hypothetical protein J4050_14695 [Winogradskyella sp. DF17]|uniref:T9SS type A sorting domain-containing protein n=1 Tax=Winogradskyella pelagia TaxID=2819984 RepID=A0ABS3T5I1_9FLAO|nr:hypothetical protein [Winogradskyella sp. DF17]MBO3118003.1 hypothetical protein [Winogradskyella sp. DF17]
MKKITLFSLLLTALSISVSGQIKIAELTFENAGGYTTSIPEFTDADKDHFLRTDGSDTAGEVFTNIQGNFYFHAQDIDGEGALLPVSLLINDLNISGYENLELRIHLAEDDAGASQDWDEPDYVHINFDIDNSGTFSNLLWIENDGSTFNSAPFIDTDFDGTGDGIEITDNFEQFTESITGFGTLLDIQIIFSLDTEDEDIAIDNIELWGTLATCSSTTTWDGTTWDNGAPDINTSAIINGPYTTSIPTAGSFTTCNLEVNANLFVDNGDFVEVINDVTVNAGTLTTETQGSFVQRGSTFTLSGGDAVVIKTTIPNTENDYTYWSSPVDNISILDGLTEANPNRRYTFNSNNYLDSDGDGVDDDANAWTDVTDTDIMEAGKGYISMHGFFPIGFGVGYDYLFEGPYNTGDISQAVPFDPSNTVNHWNLLGNPYPSALDADDFFTANTSVVASELFMWSQVSPPNDTNPGNEVLNFNQNDYITINSMGTAGNGTTPAPSNSVPSGQSFFIPSISAGNVIFTNTMRLSGANVNDEFYRNGQQNTYGEIERLWLNLSSDIGVYSQICVAYSNNATDGYDGKGIDTERNYAGNAGLLYSTDNNNAGFYVIQGKAKSSLNENEIINVGFASYLSTSEIYSISLPDFEGEYLENNPIYLRDNDLGIVHDLKSSAYEFISIGGDFANRFDIIFADSTLSNLEDQLLINGFTIVENEDDLVEFTLSNKEVIFDRIEIFDVQGRKIFDFNGDSNLEIFDFSDFKSSIFIAKAHISNGQVITKKAIKRK